MSASVIPERPATDAAQGPGPDPGAELGAELATGKRVSATHRRAERAFGTRPPAQRTHTKRTHTKRAPGDRGSVLARIVSIVSLLGALVPPLYLVSVSLMGRDETVAGVLLPAAARWENYASVVTASDLPRSIGVSVLVAVLAAVLSLAGGLGAAWSISRLRVGGNRAVGVLLSPWMLPPIVAVVPLFLLLRGVGLLGTIPGLVLVYALVNLPVVLWLLLPFVGRIPGETLEAARLDGASESRILVSLGLPLLAPALVAVGLIVGLQNYHEFLLSTFLAQGPASGTAPVTLSLFYGDRIPHVGRIAAAGVLTALPPVLAALLLQRKLVSGLTHGSAR